MVVSSLVAWGGWAVTLTSAPAADAAPVVSASHGLAADPLFGRCYFSFLACPRMSLQAEVKESCGKSVCGWSLFCPFHYPLFSMYLWGRADFLLPTKSIFDVCMTYFTHILRGKKKGHSLVWTGKVAANGDFSWQHTFFGSPSLFKYPGARSSAGRRWEGLQLF